MSHIIVTGEDINSIVYKYLLEHGYKHAAFSLEHEANLDPELVLKRRIPPHYLPTLLQQALLLRYMETHVDNNESVICTAPFGLINEHSCAVTERSLLGKRALIKQSNVEMAKEIAESLARIDYQTEELPPGLLGSQVHVPNPISMNKTKSLKREPGSQKPKEESSNQVVKESLNGSNQKPKEPVLTASKSAKETVISVVDEPKPQTVDSFDKIEPKELVLPYNVELVESYFDGLGTYLLLKVREGNTPCYIVSQLSSGEMTNLFILPSAYLQTSTFGTQVILRKHLITVTEQGEMCFINHSLRTLQTKLKFSMKAPKQIIHDYYNSIYVIICERKAYIVDDLSFGLKRDIAGSYESAAVNIDGKVIFLGEGNTLTMIDLEDKAFSQTFTSSDASRLESAKFSSLGLYLTVKYTNPYSLSVYMLNSPDSLFTFNDNLKFTDYQPVDSSKSCVVVCLDEDYMKVWNISQGKLRLTLDYGRKKILQAIVVREGKFAVVRCKKEGKVYLVDLESGNERLIWDGGMTASTSSPGQALPSTPTDGALEESTCKLIKISDNEVGLLRPKGVVFFRLPFG